MAFQVQEIFNKTVMFPYFWQTLAAIIILLFIYIKINRRHKTIELISNEIGKVRVSKQAIESMIAKTCQKVRPKSGPRVSVNSNKNKLDIKVKITMIADQKLENFTSGLQTVISSILEQNIGKELIGKIDIVVTGFTPAAVEEDHSGHEV